jgi:hypothetical protein
MENKKKGRRRWEELIGSIILYFIYIKNNNIYLILLLVHLVGCYCAAVRAVTEVTRSLRVHSRAVRAVRASSAVLT